MNHSDPELSMNDVTFTRRGVLRAGGITVGLVALLGACVDKVTDAKPARVGDAPAPENLPAPVFSDGVLFRTLTSLHFSVIDAHNIAKKLGRLSAQQTSVIDAFIAAHQESIALLQKQTVVAGSKAWTCANPRFNRVIVLPLEARITGRPKQGAEEADVAPSDNPNRDALAMAFAMESVVAASHQSLVAQFSKPAYRGESMTVGQAAARRAAALALVINPANTVNTTLVDNANVGGQAMTSMVETTTTVQNIAQTQQAGGGGGGNAPPAGITAPQAYYAVPSQFGILSAFQLAIGAPTSGTQFTLNIETPSINSFVYDYQTEC